MVVCSSLKLLHYLGLIDLSDGKRAPELSRFIRTCFPALIVVKSSSSAGKNTGEVARSPRGLDGAACTSLSFAVLALSVVLNCAVPEERL